MPSHPTRRRFVTLSVSFGTLMPLPLLARSDDRRQVDDNQLPRRAIKTSRASRQEFNIINGWVVHSDQFRTYSLPAE